MENISQIPTENHKAAAVAVILAFNSNPALVEGQPSDILDLARIIARKVPSDEFLEFEINRAIGFIPTRFLGNDQWENAVKRMAEEIISLHRVIDATAEETRQEPTPMTANDYYHQQIADNENDL